MATMANLALLRDDTQTTQDVCVRLLGYVNFPRNLPDDELPLEVPLMFYSQCIRQHPYGMRGSFEYLQKVADNGAVAIPYGRDSDGMQIVEPTAVPVPVFPPIVPPAQPGPPTPPAPGIAPPGPGVAPQPNPIAMLNSVVATAQAMAQMKVQADARSAAMACEQMDLQAATLKANAQQLRQLTFAMGNLGHDVGKAIASHPPPTIQATLSHPNAVPGQSVDPHEMGSLTRPHPVSLSLLAFNYGP